MKKTLLTLSLLYLSLGLTSCKNPETKTASEARSEAVPDDINSKKIEINTSESLVKWRGGKTYQDINKPEEGHNGTLKIKEGFLTFNEDKLESGEIIADFNTLSVIDINDPENKSKFENHMKSIDFLNIDKFPVGKFTITNVNQINENEYNYEISGNLDLLGISKNITFKAKVTRDDDNISINSEEFAINRRDFGMNYNGSGDSIIKDAIMIQVNLKSKNIK